MHFKNYIIEFYGLPVSKKINQKTKIDSLVSAKACMYP